MEALRQYDRALELWDVVPDPEDATGVRPDPGMLAACVRLRDWQALCWTLLSAVHRPDRLTDGRARLTRWLAR